VIAPGLLMPYLGAADIERIVYDPPNRRIEASHRRRFTGALRRIIEVRDQHCQHPSGCDEPAARCDVDHIVPRSRGGLTCLCNGQLLCAYHNRTVKAAGDRDRSRQQRESEPLPCIFDHDDTWTATDHDAVGDDGSRAPPQAD
jgi:hypothetical protein